MSHFPTLETDRFVLRQITKIDSLDLFNYFSLDEVTMFYDVESFTEVKQAEELIQRWNERFESSQSIRWGITLKSENRVIGTCGFHGWVKKHYKAELGYELAPDYWHQGFMTEVSKEVIEYGFNHLDLNRIQAFALPENVGSRKVLEKIGFREEGVLKEHYYWRNQFVDSVIYALLKSDYEV